MSFDGVLLRSEFGSQRWWVVVVGNVVVSILFKPSSELH